jgi:hypothetical protein
MQCSKIGAAACALTFLLAACSSHKQQTPAVALRQCNAIAGKTGVTLDVLAVNGAKKPVASVDVGIDFGGSPANGVATFSPPLQPGASRNVPVKLDTPSKTRQPPRLCVATGVTYTDGTSEGASQQ